MLALALYLSVPLPLPPLLIAHSPLVEDTQLDRAARFEIDNSEAAAKEETEEEIRQRREQEREAADAALAKAQSELDKYLKETKEHEDEIASLEEQAKEEGTKGLDQHCTSMASPPSSPSMDSRSH